MIRFVAGIFFFLTLLTEAYAAPCCGGGGGSTSFITGDARAQFTSHYLFSYVVGDAAPDGSTVFRGSDNFESQSAFFLEAAYAVQDRWQFFGRLPILYNRHQLNGDVETGGGLGDLSLGGAYELLPEWTYSPFRPKGYLFAQALIPLSSSIYNSNATADAFSRGFFTFSFGTVLVKVRNDWDFAMTLEGHQGIPRSFEIAGLQGEYQVRPGFGSTLSIGTGYTFPSFGLRTGLSLSWLYEGSVHIVDSGLPNSSSQSVWNPSIQVSYPLPQGFVISGVYTDQTLLGPVKNVALRRYFGLSLSKTWDR